MAEQGLQGCGQPLLVGGGGPAAVTGEISVDAGAGQDEDHVNRAVVGHGGRGRQADQVAAVGEPGLAGGAPEVGRGLVGRGGLGEDQEQGAGPLVPML